MTTEQKDQVDRRIAQMPEPLRTPLRQIQRSRTMGHGMRMLRDRSYELGGLERALLVGALIEPNAREELDRHLDAYWRIKSTEFQTARVRVKETYEEVIVGGGVHAAIYLATRAAKAQRTGKRWVRPLVIDYGPRVGGAFAVTSSPSFYLNSRNRPGGQGVPGEGGALNMFPNAPLQPFDTTNTEYQTNTSLADVVRVTLAMYADVVQWPSRVDGIKPSTKPEDADSPMRVWEVYAGTIRLAKATRVLIATGLGKIRNPFLSEPDSELYRDKVTDYYQFMARMDQPFPLRGLRKVAVVGYGDGGKTVIEALLGQGPPGRMAWPTLDWVDRVDWYGIGSSTTENDYCMVNRGRYRGLGRYLRADANGVKRLVPRPKAGALYSSGGSIFVDGRPYDHVVLACGFFRSKLDGFAFGPVVTNWSDFAQGGRVVAKKLNPFGGAGFDEPGGVYRIGPAAEIGLDNYERALSVFNSIPQNSTAIFRYAPRTEALANSLP